MSLAELNRYGRGIDLTAEDFAIFCCRLSADEAYAYAIADRNDSAIMLARSVLANAGCPATRNRAMPV